MPPGHGLMNYPCNTFVVPFVCEYIGYWHEWEVPRCSRAQGRQVRITEKIATIPGLRLLEAVYRFVNSCQIVLIGGTKGLILSLSALSLQASRVCSSHASFPMGSGWFEHSACHRSWSSPYIASGGSCRDWLRKLPGSYDIQRCNFLPRYPICRAPSG